MLRVTTVFNGPAGSPYYSTFYFGGDTSGEAAAAVTATEGFWDGLQAGLRTGMNSYQEQEVPRIDPATGNILEVFSTAGGTQTYTNVSDPLPPATQLLIRWRTGVFANGREIRGRTFIPGYTETSSTSGAPVGSTVTGVAALADTLLTAASPAGNLVVWSPTAGQSAQVNARSVWNQWAILRSRRD